MWPHRLLLAIVLLWHRVSKTGGKACMFVLKKLLISVVMPPFSLILMVVAGIILSRRHPRTGHTIIIVSSLTFLALSLPLISGRLTDSLQWYSPIDVAGLSQVQAIVILGGGNHRNAPEYGGDTIGFVSLERLRYGVHLHKKSGLPLLIAGGAPDGGMTEAEAMRNSAHSDFGTEIHWLESHSNNTAESAILSAFLLKDAGVSRIALVSHAWHLPRAVYLFEHAGLKVIPAPTGFQTSEFSLFDFLPNAGAIASSSRAIYEWLGILVQRF